MTLDEKFEVKFKNNRCSEQRILLGNAIIDLYKNFDNYEIIERSKGKKDQTSDFMNKFYITKFDMINLLDEKLPSLDLNIYGDILVDRDRKNNLLYILYIPNAKIGNWDYTKSREKLLYIKWNPINKKIISFHPMRDIQDTNRDELMESKTMSIQKVIDFIYTHTTDDYIIVDVNILEELKDCLKSKEKPIYTFAEVKAVKDDIIHTMSLNKEQRDALNNFVAELNSTFYNGDKIKERLEETLSYNDIIDRVFYTGNDNWHLKKFYDLRKKYNGKDVKNVHLITTEINDDGSCDILFAVDATKDNTKKKELVFGGNGAMVDNVSNEYQVIIRINDFWELLEYFDLETKGDFTKKDLVALIQLSKDIKIDSNDPSWWWQGLAYWCSLDDGAINPCNIRPKFWDAYRPNVKVSKIVEAVLRQFGFFTQQIAMSIKRALIQQNYL